MGRDNTCAWNDARRAVSHDANQCCRCHLRVNYTCWPEKQSGYKKKKAPLKKPHTHLAKSAGDLPAV
jgi:hypothetical protein